jgi:hypothetical protein
MDIRSSQVLHLSPASLQLQAELLLRLRRD